MKTIRTTFPLPGETRFFPISKDVARKIADNFYDVVNLIATGTGHYGVETRSGFEATVFSTEQGEPAILHKRDGGRELNILGL